MGVKRHRERVAAIVGGELVDASWVRRLARISFLGTLDAHPRSRRASTRFEHSLAVANLGADVATALALTPDQTRAFVAACLLHDVGHYPLSHAAEPAFERALGASHHGVTEWIVRGMGRIETARSLRPILEARDIDPERVWATIDGEGPLAEFLKAPINLDTLDGITRVARDFGVRKSQLPESVFAWVDGEPGISAAAVEAIDRFWMLKDRIYDTVINLPSNILAETRLCEVVAASVTSELFDEFERFDDPMLVRILGPEFERFGLCEREDEDYEFRNHAAWGQVLVRMRKRYYVDTSAELATDGLAMSRLRTRYRHVREPAYLISKRHQLELPHTSTTIMVEDPEI